MTQPFVGAPTVPDDAGCAYSPTLDAPPCGRVVAVHIIGRAAGWGWVALSSCIDHRSIAEAGLAEVADIHAPGECSGQHRVPDGEQ